MPTPTVAPSEATTIALDFTARQARQANTEVGQRRRVGGLTGGQRPVRGVVARGVERVALLHQQPPADRAEFVPAALRFGRDEDANVLLALQDLDRASARRPAR